MKKKRIGFLVSHGTDTMAWGVSYLNYTLKNLAFNICFVGSQIPMEEKPNGSDGYLNVESAVFALAKYPPPKVMVAMNGGKHIFLDDIWKVDKWDISAFTGKVLEEKKSNQIILEQDEIVFNNYKLDKLIVVKTGGTIEQKLQEGRLKVEPNKDKIGKFIKNRFGKRKNNSGFFISEIEIYELLSKDSSDMRIEYWKKVAKFIIEIAEKEGYNPIFEDKISNNVGVLFNTPLTLTNDLMIQAGNKKGIVLVGYGGGNVNIEEDSGYSPLPFLEEMKKNNVPVVLSSHPAYGALDPIYENGGVVFDRKLALPSIDFSIARSQIKLSYILNTIDSSFIKKVNEHIGYNGDLEELKEKIIAILFLSGAEFPKGNTKLYFENKWEIKIPEEDLIARYEKEELIKKVIKFLKHKENKEIYFARKVYKNLLKPYIVILKPDEIVGYSLSGAEIDASKNISLIVKNSFEYDIVYVPLEKGISLSKRFYEFIFNAKLVFGEGGRQSVYDSKTFNELGSISRNEMIELYKRIVLKRAESFKSPSSINICLSHQLMADVLYSIVIDIIDNKNVIAKKIGDSKVINEFSKIIKKIENKWKEFLKKPHSIVKPGEKPEVKIIDLRKYKINPNINDKEIVTSYREVSDYFSGMVEDFIEVDKIDITMLHGDEVSEKGILFVNWALWELWKFKKKNWNALKSIKELQIPIGVEITSSTYDGKNVMTEVGSMSVYYVDKEGYLYRDYTFQFHPELMISDEIRELYGVKEMRLSPENDGLKMLISAIISSREKFKLIF